MNYLLALTICRTPEELSPARLGAPIVPVLEELYQSVSNPRNRNHIQYFNQKEHNTGSLLQRSSEGWRSKRGKVSVCKEYEGSSTPLLLLEGAKRERVRPTVTTTTAPAGEPDQQPEASPHVPQLPPCWHCTPAPTAVTAIAGDTTGRYKKNGFSPTSQYCLSTVRLNRRNPAAGSPGKSTEEEKTEELIWS